MPVIPNSNPPEPEEQPSQEVQNPERYRFEGFDLHGGNQGTMRRDIQRDTLIWNPRKISQPLAFSRRSFSTFKVDLRR